MKVENRVHRKLAFSIQEAAIEISLSPAFIRKLIREGKLKVAKCGSRVLIRADELDRYLNENTN